VWTETQLVDLITSELEQEFVDYGYIKVTKWLKNDHKFLINKKKVYRIMHDHALLHCRPVRSAVRKLWIKELVPNPTMPLTHLEFDIKYMHVHGNKRNAMMLTVNSSAVRHTGSPQDVQRGIAGRRSWILGSSRHRSRRK